MVCARVDGHEDATCACRAEHSDDRLGLLRQEHGDPLLALEAERYDGARKALDFTAERSIVDRLLLVTQCRAFGMGQCRSQRQLV